MADELKYQVGVAGEDGERVALTVQDGGEAVDVNISAAGAFAFARDVLTVAFEASGKVRRRRKPKGWTKGKAEDGNNARGSENGNPV